MPAATAIPQELVIGIMLFRLAIGIAADAAARPA
jgi:hypothetical protein